MLPSLPPGACVASLESDTTAEPNVLMSGSGKVSTAEPA